MDIILPYLRSSDISILQSRFGTKNITTHLAAEIHVDLSWRWFAEYKICLPAGTQTVWHSLVKIPNPALNAATGISESMWESLKKYPLVQPLHSFHRH